MRALGVIVAVMIAVAVCAAQETEAETETPKTVEERLEILTEKYKKLARKNEELNTRLNTLIRKVELREEAEYLAEVRRTTKVKNLEPETFGQVKAGGKWFVVLSTPFWTPWKEISPVLEVVAKAHNSEYNVAKMDCQRFHEACKEAGWHDMFTVQLYVDGKVVNEYDGARTVRAVEEFAAETFGTPLPA